MSQEISQWTHWRKDLFIFLTTLQGYKRIRTGNWAAPWVWHKSRNAHKWVLSGVSCLCPKIVCHSLEREKFAAVKWDVYTRWKIYAFNEEDDGVSSVFPYHTPNLYSLDVHLYCGGWAELFAFCRSTITNPMSETQERVSRWKSPNSDKWRRASACSKPRNWLFTPHFLFITP